MGFTNAEKLGFEPSTAEQYQTKGMPCPKPGTWFQDNGVIAAVNSDGAIYLWVPKADPKAPRTVSHEQAIETLKKMGYTEKNH